MRSYRRVAAILAAVALCLSGLACAHAPASAPAGGPATLYQRLGGAGGIQAIVDQFVGTITTDTRIGHYFADTDLGPFKDRLAQLIDQSTGGSEKYAGRDMKTTHAGLGISAADFDALIEDLGRALDQRQVGAKEKAELLAILMPLRRDIVEK